MSRRILVTGGDGFVGSHLIAALRKQGFDVHAPVFELRSWESILGAVSPKNSDAPWDCVVHLAGVSHVPTCDKQPGLAFQVNLSGTALVVEALKRVSPRAPFVFASTAQIYRSPTLAEAASRVAIDEAWEVAPQNVYAQSKWQCEMILKDAARDGLGVTSLRFFNHTHKTQAPDFFLPRIYRELSAAPKGEVLRMPVGNLDIYRDMGAIQDLVSALVAVVAAEKDSGSGRFEAYNICSGTPKNLRGLAASLASRVGVQVDFVTDPSRVRAGEPAYMCGSHAKFAARYGWKPKFASEDAFITAFLLDAAS